MHKHKKQNHSVLVSYNAYHDTYIKKLKSGLEILGY